MTEAAFDARERTATARDDIAGLLTELSTTLAAEFGALRAHDVALLEAVVAQKLALVGALEKACSDIRDDPEASARGNLQPLNELARNCLRANRINGGSIELNRNMIDRLLDTLRGTSHTPVYDAGGRVQRHQNGRPVGSA